MKKLLNYFRKKGIEMTEESKKINKFKIEFIQEDNHIIEVIVNEDELEDSFKTLENGNVLFSKDRKSGYWLNLDKVRCARFKEIDISPDPEENQKEHLEHGIDSEDLT